MSIAPPVSAYARVRKANYFLRRIPPGSRVLEIGCGDGWVREFLAARPGVDYVGLDLRPPADVVGDIRNWRELGLEPESFDAIVAFEVVEHVDCFDECYALLKPGGSLMVTTPVPHMDWLLRLFEILGLNQKRTSPHSNLVYCHRVDRFPGKELRTVGLLSQWAILTKPSRPARAAAMRPALRRRASPVSRRTGSR